jgi:hypothetical protein
MTPSLIIEPPDPQKRNVVGLTLQFQKVACAIPITAQEIQEWKWHSSSYKAITDWIMDIVKDSLQVELSEEFDTRNLKLSFSVKLPVRVAD